MSKIYINFFIDLIFVIIISLQNFWFIWKMQRGLLCISSSSNERLLQYWLKSRLNKPFANNISALVFSSSSWHCSEISILAGNYNFRPSSASSKLFSVKSERDTRAKERRQIEKYLFLNVITMRCDARTRNFPRSHFSMRFRCVSRDFLNSAISVSRKMHLVTFDQTEFDSL